MNTDTYAHTYISIYISIYKYKHEYIYCNTWNVYKYI